MLCVTRIQDHQRVSTQTVNKDYQCKLLLYDYQRGVSAIIINAKCQQLLSTGRKVPRSIIILLSMQSISHYHQREIHIKNIKSNLNHNKTENISNPSPIVFIFFF